MQLVEGADAILELILIHEGCFWRLYTTTLSEEVRVYRRMYSEPQRRRAPNNGFYLRMQPCQFTLFYFS